MTDLEKKLASRIYRPEKPNMASGAFLKKLKEVGRTLFDCSDCPVFWDAFYNVVARGESSHDDDNPFVPQEFDSYVSYKIGAEAGEALLHEMKNNAR